MPVNTTYGCGSNRTPAVPLLDWITRTFLMHQNAGRSLNCYAVYRLGETRLWRRPELRRNYGGLRLVWISYLRLDLNAGAPAFRGAQLGHLV